ncbi:DNA-binding response regulator [Arthrobacter sp. SW1]|uniref:response regulator transcription factor n=1 Tax=Arthrobacter sp. SW1 TaxID=1920889 RepID=UPI000877BB22|nr:response regulator transcription factor [Arthrobacter sp. SW1]OFI37352.1 DNA-binding response regulator [Arthrobacter sp. SW1]
MTRILIAEDEPRISDFIAKGLKAAGFTTVTVGDGIKALDYGTSGEFDLMLLDLGMPRMDGISVLSSLRSMGSPIPVIVLTARGTLQDTVAALDGGADDYMTKPFRFEELLSRIRLRLRNHPGAQAAPPLACGDVALDVELRCATVAGATVQLSAREFAMARTFLENQGKVLSREQLLSHVWGYDFDGSSNVVDVYVGYLRAKLGQERILTVRGAGYRFVNPGTPHGSAPQDENTLMDASSASHVRRPE